MSKVFQVHKMYFVGPKRFPIPTHSHTQNISALKQSSKALPIKYLRQLFDNSDGVPDERDERVCHKIGNVEIDKFTF